MVSPGTPRGFGFARAATALLAIITLVWGAQSGHAVECVTAVLAAVLVEAIGRFLRVRKAV